MDSIDELKRRSFDRSRSKIIAALEREPMGLQVSQIMTICQLSNKTVKSILPTLNATESNGVWSVVRSNRNTSSKSSAQPKPEQNKHVASCKQVTDKVTPKHDTSCKQASPKADTACKQVPPASDTLCKKTVHVARSSQRTVSQNLDLNFHKEETDTQKTEPKPAQQHDLNQEIEKIMTEQNKSAQNGIEALSALQSKAETIVTRTTTIDLDISEVEGLLKELFNMTHIEWRENGLHMAKTENSLNTAGL